MSLAELFGNPLWSRLASMHWHFLWQGAMIAGLYWALTKLFNVRSARLRYSLSMLGLVGMLASTVVTFWLVDGPIQEPAANSGVATAVEGQTPPLALLTFRESAGSLSQAKETRSEKASVPVPIQDQGNKKASSFVTATKEPSPSETQSAFIPSLLAAWFTGVVIFGLRLLGGLGTIVWWRRSALEVRDPYWIDRVHQISREFRLARAPRLAVSPQAKDACSLGLFRPLIVLPSSWMLQLPADALEAVLAHELAHIRRFDAWANLFQRVLEAWLFYHPAVWWLSREADKEREKCCDLWAVSLTGDRLLYVKTLAGIAEYQRAARLAKSKGPILATGMGGRNMVLLERVRHILEGTPRTGAASRFLAGTMVLAIPAALWVGTMMLPASAADEDGVAIAQADGDRDGNRRRDGDAPRVGPRDGDRPRGDGPRDGDRPRPEGQRDGDRPRGDGPRDGDRPRPEGQRDGDRPRGEGPRDGDRPRPEGERDGDRPRPEGRPGGFPPRGPEGGFGPPRFRDGEGPGGDGRPAPQGELIELIRELRREVEQLRNEVRELRESRDGGPRPEFRRPDGFPGPMGPGGPRPAFRRPGSDRPDARPDGNRPEGDRPDARPDGNRPEGDRPDARPEGERPRIRVEQRRIEIRRPEGDAERREVDEDRERLEKAREERDAQGEAEVNVEKRSAAEILFVFTRLDRNNNNKLDQEEWEASKSIRQGFERHGIKVSPPVDLKTFRDLYPQERIVPELKLPGERD